MKPSNKSIFFEKLSTPLITFNLALLLWIFVVSNNDYSMVIDIPIEARNLSALKAHREEVPKYAQARLKGTGRDLFGLYLFKNFIEFKAVIDLEGISKEYEFVLNDYFKNNPQKIVLPSKYSIEFIEIIYPSRIQISLDDMEEKQVPILSNIKVMTEPGFMIIGEVHFEPNFITIAGPKEDLVLINHVKTQFDTLIGANNSLSGNINLQSKGRLINFSEDQIHYYVNIEEISERIIAGIPVNIINIPNNIRVFPSPQTVALTVIGGLKQISNLRAEEINVTLDFNYWSSKQQFYEPNVSVPKSVIKWQDLSPRSLELGVARQSK
ncbi:MAG: hypothetical protein CMG62_05255 [Candidatus Marinimicrobia bacterium]|nr:hypothetical protein [Candidatus Neomarinimicrobiota bacterium]